MLEIRKTQMAVIDGDNTIMAHPSRVLSEPYGPPGSPVTDL